MITKKTYDDKDKQRWHETDEDKENLWENGWWRRWLTMPKTNYDDKEDDWNLMEYHVCILS